MRATIGPLTLLLVATGCGGPEGKAFHYPLDGQLRLDHVQAKATHNSYHVEQAGNTVDSWRFTQLPLDQQLDLQGVRGVELDLNLENDGEYHVYHVAFADQQSVCPTFVACLEALWGWSSRFPGHLPIYVHIELKSNFPDEDPEPAFRKLEDDVRSVLPDDRLLTPADVAAGRGALGPAVAAQGWPTLGELRGRFYFVLDNEGSQREAYTHGGRDLDDRLMFVDSNPGDPFAAIAILNDPVADAATIRAAHAAHMLVRTRADADGVEARANDRSRFEAALAIGAQIVTTDFPGPQQAVGGYWIDIPDGTPARCDPMTAPSACTALAIEDPAFVGTR